MTATLEMKKTVSMPYSEFQQFAIKATTLEYAQRIQLITILANSLKPKQESKKLTKEQSLELFNELTGSIKNVKEINAREEMNEYLDERYGV